MDVALILGTRQVWPSLPVSLPGLGSISPAFQEGRLEFTSTLCLVWGRQVLESQLLSYM